MGRNRVLTSVTVDPDLFDRAKENKIILSALLDEAIESKLRMIRFFGLNKKKK